MYRVPRRKAPISYENLRYKTFSKGVLGKDTLGFAGDKGEWQMKEFEFGVIDSTNITGMLGLGKDSTFLQKLRDDKKIGSKSFGLHVGVDIWNHPYPALNPSFDESGRVPTTGGDGEFGKRGMDGLESRADKQTALPVRESHKFPGSLTLGGYDKSKISNKTKPLTIPLAADGSLKLSLTNMILRNGNFYSPYDIVNKTYSVIIDPDTPHMYFPDTFARGIGRIMGAPYGEPGYDFFYTSIIESMEDYLGNLTITLKSPDGKGDEIDITIPPTVWYQPIGYMRNMEPVGNVEGYNYYAPIREYRGEELPIVLGRSFLKAAYLFVNYDANNFQISQVAYANSTRDIVSVNGSGGTNNGADTTGTFGGNTPVPTGNDKKNPDGTEKKSGPPMAVLAGAAGGGFLLVGALIFLIFFLKRKRKTMEAKKHKQLHESRPGSRHTVDLPAGGRNELHSDDVAMTDIKRPQTSGSTHFSGLVLPPHNAAELPPSHISELAPSSPVGMVNELPEKMQLNNISAVAVPEMPSPAAPIYQPHSPPRPQTGHAPLHELGNNNHHQGAYHEMASAPQTPQPSHAHPAIYPPPSQPLPPPPPILSRPPHHHTNSGTTSQFPQYQPQPPAARPAFMVAGYGQTQQQQQQQQPHLQQQAQQGPVNMPKASGFVIPPPPPGGPPPIGGSPAVSPYIYQAGFPSPGMVYGGQSQGGSPVIPQQVNGVPMPMPIPIPPPPKTAPPGVFEMA
ncbi:hypothetical protein DFH27DRAFT_597708 [Peziza echinospora]|nr:hypothetical protein DFH27DRAFT_597708 [Peziza echinospora]